MGKVRFQEGQWFTQGSAADQGRGPAFLYLLPTVWTPPGSLPHSRSCLVCIGSRQHTPLMAQWHSVFLSPLSTEHSAELLAGTGCSFGQSLRWAEEGSGRRQGRKMLERGEELQGLHVCELVSTNGSHDQLPAVASSQNCAKLGGCWPHSVLTRSWWGALIQVV